MVTTWMGCSFPRSSNGRLSRLESSSAAFAALAVTRISPAVAAEASRAVVLTASPEGSQRRVRALAYGTHPRHTRVNAGAQRNPGTPEIGMARGLEERTGSVDAARRMLLSTE
jgi:hypothetical protein